MKNTKKNSTIVRATGVALSAIMIMSVSAATLATANVSAMPTDNVTGTKPIERMPVMDINTGKDVKAGTHNMFAIKNTQDLKSTTLAVKDESSQARIQLYDGNMNPIDYTTKRLSKDGKIQVTIPMNPEDPVWYFVDVYQVPSPTATDFSFAHLDEQGLRKFNSTVLEEGSSFKPETIITADDNGDGTTTEVSRAQGTFAVTPDETGCYNLHIVPEEYAFYQLKMYDEEGNFLGECHGNIEPGFPFINNFYFEEGKTLYFDYKLICSPDTTVEFTFEQGELW